MTKQLRRGGGGERTTGLTSKCLRGLLVETQVVVSVVSRRGERKGLSSRKMQSSFYPYYHSDVDDVISCIFFFSFLFMISNKSGWCVLYTTESHKDKWRLNILRYLGLGDHPVRCGDRRRSGQEGRRDNVSLLLSDCNGSLFFLHFKAILSCCLI